MDTYHCVDCRVHAQGCIFGGEGPASVGDQVGVSCTGPPLRDVLHGGLAAKRRVVGAARRQEVGGLVSCHHLARIGKDGGGEEAKGVDACGTRETK